MSTPREQPQSLAEALGCGLLLMGVLGVAFGLAALLGVSDRIELEFFGIALNDTPGRRMWTAGSTAALVAGVLILRKRAN
ncbi:MAG: hypothetical protein O2795_07575 [Acidobacteria bacterium]|nr:hypothetical protein [Acidobacteriota bacterium]